MKWDPLNSVFTSELGFYSHWFSFQEFKTLLEEHLEAKAEIIPLASQGMLGKVLLSDSSKVSQSAVRQSRKPSLRVLCPTCGKVIGIVPVSEKELVCDVCKHAYKVSTIENFQVPSLFYNQLEDQ